MDRNKVRDLQHHRRHLGMNTPPIVPSEEWEAARQQFLVKEKSLTRARDALAAERRRMPWMAVEKRYEFEGPSKSRHTCNSHRSIRAINFSREGKADFQSTKGPPPAGLTHEGSM